MKFKANLEMEENFSAYGKKLKFEMHTKDKDNCTMYIEQKGEHDFEPMFA